MVMEPHVEHVGRAALPETLETLRAVVKDASFVAFDTELSGLSALLEKPSLMDSVAQRYSQLRDSAQSYSIVQFGLSCFTWRAEAREFEVRTFQFPVFPGFRQHNDDNNGIKGLPDRSFLAQAKCLTYIRDHGFDLNQWVDEGIGYLSHHEQDGLESMLKKPLREDVQAKFKGDSSAKIRTEENERFLNDMKKRVKALVALVDGLKSEATETAGRLEEDEDAAAQAFLQEPLKNNRPSVHATASGVSRCVFVTEPQAPFRRNALISTIETLYPTVVVLDCPADNDDDKEVKATPWKRRLRLIATRDDAEIEAMRRAHDRVIKKEHDLHNLSLVGFTSVMDVLMDAGNRTPIVGHNMMLDLMQCYDKFHGPLPESCSEFMHKLAEWLNGVNMFDTKVIVEHAMEHVDLFGDKLEHSALEYVYKTITKDPFHGPTLRNTSPNPSSASDSDIVPKLSAHQAGYDAFMTGSVFLRVCCGLGVPNEAIASIHELCQKQSHVPRWHETMLKLRNEFTLSRLLPPVMLKLPGPFPSEVETPSRSTFLRMALTRAWLPKVKPFHIQQSIGWALGLRAIKLVKVRYENKSSVFIQLPAREHVDELINIRKECAEVHGTDRDPLPSLGCVDLFRCEELNEGNTSTGIKHSADEADQPTVKRPRLEVINVVE